MGSRDQGIKEAANPCNRVMTCDAPDDPRASIRTYRDLVAWQKAYSLGLEIYRLTRILPESERYGLTSQMRRAAVSISSNIAEGYGRGGRADYARFLKLARGSLYEVDTQLLYCLDLEFITTNAYASAKAVLDESERVLAGLIRAIDRE